MSATKSQLLATANFHDRLQQVQAQRGIRAEDAKRHKADARKLRRKAAEMRS